MELYWIAVLLAGYFLTAQGAPPTFSSSTRSVDVLESLAAGGFVTSLVANDADGDAISYTLVSVNPASASSLFNVAVTGEVTTTGKLDYETSSSYILSVRAESNGETGEQALTLNVVNVNEAPVFEQDIYDVAISDEIMTGHMIANLTAVDPDETPEILYVIAGGSGGDKFQIDGTSGLVTTTTTTELDTNAFLLVVEASDNGTPKLTGTTTLVIAVCSGSVPGVACLRLWTASIIVLLTHLFRKLFLQ